MASSQAATPGEQGASLPEAARGSSRTARGGAS